MHLLLNRLEVALGDGFHGKIIVETTVNGRTYGRKGAGIEFHDGLRQQVSGGMAQDMDAFFRIGRDALNGTVDVKHLGQIAFGTVHLGGQATVLLAHGIGDNLAAGDARGVFVNGPVRQRDVNHAHGLKSPQPLRG